MPNVVDIYAATSEMFSFLGPDGFSMFFCFVLFLGVFYLLD